jgi:hypothetical protein
MAIVKIPGPVGMFGLIWRNKMKYPDWLHGKATSLMQLPKPYIEYFVRWYYYDNTDETQIPDTIPVENIEDYILD